MQSTEMLEEPTPAGWLRPQSVVFTLLAEHLLDRDLPALFAGSFIAALERVGVTEHATRATLARMNERGLLDKHKHGRKTFFQMTPRCVAILEGGRERIWLTGAVNREPVEHWTLVTFSLPEDWQRKRYELRVRLGWAGFGALQPGVWIAPGAPDVAPILEELSLQSHAHVFRADALHPADPRALARQAYDLQGLSARYAQFIETWRPQLDASCGDPLALTLRLSTEWLDIIRNEPRLPLQLLPERWPAPGAQALFRTLHERHRADARCAADALFELSP